MRIATVVTGAKSRSVSYDNFEYVCGLITSELVLPSITVYPSGGDFATMSEPMVPAAPARLSKITCWPSGAATLIGARRISTG